MALISVCQVPYGDAYSPSRTALMEQDVVDCNLAFCQMNVGRHGRQFCPLKRDVLIYGAYNNRSQSWCYEVSLDENI